MSCQFNVSHTGDKNQLVDNLRNAILQVNGTFDGDVSHGVFRGDTPLGSFSGSYDVHGDEILIRVDDKPFLISCSRIESEIRKYLGKQQ